MVNKFVKGPPLRESEVVNAGSFTPVSSCHMWLILTGHNVKVHTNVTNYLLCLIIFMIINVLHIQK